MSKDPNKSNHRAVDALLGYITPVSVLAVLLVGAIVVIAAMGYRIYRWRGAEQGQNPTATGMQLAPFAVRDGAGKAMTIPVGHTEEPVVLYILNPDCYWCARNIENIRALARRRGSEFTFIGISTPGGDLRRYRKSALLPFPIYSVATINDIKPLQLARTPETIVVSPKGKVVKNWIGAYTGDVQDEIGNYFDVKLPGLTKP